MGAPTLGLTRRGLLQRLVVLLLGLLLLPLGETPARARRRRRHLRETGDLWIGHC